MSDQLFREVDEEVRQDRFQAYWKRYGVWFAAAAALIVAVTIGYVVWQNMQESARQGSSDAFVAAITGAADDREAAITQLRDLAAEATPGYRLLARMREAALLAETGRPEEAVAAFDVIAADDGVDDLYRDLARLFSVANGLEILSPDEVRARIGGLDTADNPLRFSAREYLAAAALKAGERDSATDLLRSITDDPAAPQGIRSRAAELLQALGS